MNIKKRIAKNIICQYFWEDGKTLTAHADKNKFIEEVSNTFCIDKNFNI